MQQSRGEWAHGGEPADFADRERAGTAEPITLTDLDGAVTRIAPFSTWTREQVRHPGDEPLFITRLERGQLWHRAAQQAKTWAHEIQVGPATVVTERGRFHVVAEPDGGATITCLEGQVAVATQLTSALLLQRDEAVSIAADGETCVVVEPTRATAVGPATIERTRWPAERRSSAGGRVWPAITGRRNLVVGLLILVAVLLVILIIVLVVDHGGASGSSIGVLTRHAAGAAQWTRHP